MSESCFSSIVHRDFHNAMMAKKDAEIEALRAEVSTPVLVATNRLADALVAVLAGGRDGLERVGAALLDQRLDGLGHDRQVDPCRSAPE